MTTEVAVKYEDLKKLSISRIDEAKFLYSKKHYSGSYYIAGYSIELALKAYYCKQRFFPPRNTDDFYKHDLNKLRESCGLKDIFEKEAKKNKELFSSWNVVKDWNSDARYRFFDKKQAYSLIEAITNNKSGILLWIKTKW